MCRAGLRHGPTRPWSRAPWFYGSHTKQSKNKNWPVCSLSLHGGQLILRKISKIGATRCQTQLGELTALPRPLAVFQELASEVRKGRERGSPRTLQSLNLALCMCCVRMYVINLITMFYVDSDGSICE